MRPFETPPTEREAKAEAAEPGCEQCGDPNVVDEPLCWSCWTDAAVEDARETRYLRGSRA